MTTTNVANLPDPGEGRSWYLTADGELQLWRGVGPDESGDYYPLTSWEISSQYVDPTQVVPTWKTAKKMVALADLAGTYTYENGGLVKK